MRRLSKLWFRRSAHQKKTRSYAEPPMRRPRELASTECHIKKARSDAEPRMRHASELVSTQCGAETRAYAGLPMRRPSELVSTRCGSENLALIPNTRLTNRCVALARGFGPVRISEGAMRRRRLGRDVTRSVTIKNLSINTGVPRARGVS